MNNDLQTDPATELYKLCLAARSFRPKHKLVRQALPECFRVPEDSAQLLRVTAAVVSRFDEVVAMVMASKAIRQEALRKTARNSLNEMKQLLMPVRTSEQWVAVIDKTITNERLTAVQYAGGMLEREWPIRLAAGAG